MTLIFVCLWCKLLFCMFFFSVHLMCTAKLAPVFSLHLVLRALVLWCRLQATGAWKPKWIPSHRDPLDSHLLKRGEGSSLNSSLSWNSFHMHTQSERKQILHEQVYGRRSRHFHWKDVILFLLRLLVKFPSASVRVKVECEQNPEWLPRLPNKFYVVVAVFRNLVFRQMIEIWKVEEVGEKQKELFCLDQRNAVTTCSLNNKLTLRVEMKWKCFSFSMSLWNNHFFCIFLPMKWIIFIRIQMFLCKNAALPYCTNFFHRIDKLCLFVYHLEFPSICQVHHQKTETAVPALLSIKSKFKDNAAIPKLVIRVLRWGWA